MSRFTEQQLKKIREINKNRKPTIGFTEEDFRRASERVKPKILERQRIARESKKNN